MSKLYKEPKRKKYQQKRSLILKADQYKHQYRHVRKRDILYQNQLLHSHGAELMYLYSWVALEDTVKEFNEAYGDNMHIKHAVLLIVIKHYTVAKSRPDFKTRDLTRFFPPLWPLLGRYAGNTFALGTLVGDLYNMHFVNMIREYYVTTTRVKIFTGMFNKNLKAQYEGANE